MRVDGDPCIAASFCDDGFLVTCEDRGPSSFGHLERRACPALCLERDDDEAFCVEDAAPCNPATVIPVCRDGAGGREVVICSALFRDEPRAFLQAVPAGCVEGELVTCRPDGSATLAACPEENVCIGLDPPGERTHGCVHDVEPCHPATFEERCSRGDRVVACRDLSGAGAFFPVALPLGEPGTTLTRCP
jgi:hypothetical protein